MKDKQVFTYLNGKKTDRYTIEFIQSKEKEDCDDFLMLNVLSAHHPDKAIQGFSGLVLDNTNEYVLELLRDKRAWECLSLVDNKLWMPWEEFGKNDPRGMGLVWFKEGRILHHKYCYNHQNEGYLQSFFEKQGPLQPRARPLNGPEHEEDELEEDFGIRARPIEVNWDAAITVNPTLPRTVRATRR